MANYYQHETALVGKDVQIGDDTRIWAFVNIQEGAVIGKGCNICDSCYIEGGSYIGNNVTVKNGVSVFEGITLENDVFCGANVAFINDRHPRSNRKDPWVLEKTYIRHGATLGSNATILCGITVGKYSFVGAGSVVTKDVAPFSMVCGSPAKPVGYVCHCGRKLEDNYKCSECDSEYYFENEELNLKQTG